MGNSREEIFFENFMKIVDDYLGIDGSLGDIQNYADFIEKIMIEHFEEIKRKER